LEIDVSIDQDVSGFSGPGYSEPVDAMPIDQAEMIGDGGHVLGALATHNVVELQSDSEIPDFDGRETRYILGLFGDEGLNMVDVQQRAALAFAVNEMFFHDNNFKDANYDTYAVRLQNYFSDKTMGDLMTLSRSAGRAYGVEPERTFYAKVKRGVLEKFNYHQTRAVLDMAIHGEGIDWDAVAELAGKGAPVPKKAKKASPKRAPEQRPVALSPSRILSMTRRMELEDSDFDPYAIAEHPPLSWQNDLKFIVKFDDHVALLFDQAVEKTSLSPMNANAIRRHLRLPLGIVSKDAPMFEQKPFEYLHATMAVYPGRLKDTTSPRTAVMRQLLQAFTTERLTFDQIIKRYGGNPDAGLLLKGAIAELLTTRIQAEQERYT
jgi:hypothetical protein